MLGGLLTLLALSLVDQGIVTPQDIDDAVRFGFGFRFAALGPMAQKEMSGWDTHVASGASVYPSIGGWSLSGVFPAMSASASSSW